MAQLMAVGHTVRLMAAKFVHPYRKGQTTARYLMDG
jgi:hypothetical protein